MKSSGYKTGLLLRLGIGLLSVVLLFQIAQRYPFRIDMTEEKRYSISEPTKKLLQRLDQDVVVEVYLAGELPGNFLRFQKAIRELLEEFAIYTPGTLDVKLVDPAQASSSRARNQYFQGLIQQGLQPTNLNYSQDGKNTQKLIFPGAVISMGGRELAVNLLKGNRASGPEAIINQSIEGLEYAFANALQQLANPTRKRVGLVLGHGEPDTTQLAGLTNLILSKYDLFRINLPERKTPITGYDLLLITKPTKPFSEREKYLLDQYVMAGGRVAFFLDALRVNMDSASGEGTVAIPYETNLNDLLFRYGVRINQNYVVDLNCGDFPVVAGNIGDQPQIRMLPWPYFPVITNYGKHPVVRNLDAVMTRFVSSIDTVKAVGVEKTPLLLSSNNTKVLGAPITVAFNDLQSELLPEKFQKGPQALGYLLEGTFTSMYKNRFPPAGFSRNEIVPESAPNKLVVIADGDLIRNELSLEDGKPLQMGLDPYSQKTYANEDLVMNLVDYLLDEDGLVQTRAKEVKIRPLDKVKVKQERLKWQLVNVALPVILLVLFGIVKMTIRKRRNTY
ncbi:gliding motility-associated ABC transporter substrate-binding protein GldG [Marinoscillum furvescens]|uniref:Gliding-associated putative ABC transporter substrate-binding component GldG n=1 Tax=Marinoscillum furvescens DSM 4134 TaxID=1122208 RepID=A0A3D9LGX9_MARFU|nr:gliding motility-associated ABC transporter substrate-binding protein GldG [Marinoscillum furvescens]REE05651.1 gliding-associated putative ABC transporter substrate-binding component GldG [Marinoscillum furvescens DSM 4134]